MKGNMIMTRRTHSITSLAIYTSFVGIDPIGVVIAGAIANIPDLDLVFGRKFHRQGTHSLLALFLFNLLLFIIAPQYLLAGIVGYGSHLLLDSLTPSGVPLFYPNKKRFRFPLVKTGSLGDILFGALASIFFVLNVINI